MSQYPSVPPPGAYTPANQAPQPPAFQQQPHFGYQQSQAPSPYGAPAPGYNQPGSNKPTKTLGQVFNQTVTQGKPMLDKLGKSISSKLSKQPKQTTPQHLQNYQSYQQHHQQGQPQVQQYPQGQLQNYPNQGQPFTPGQQSVYQTPQQSPFGQSTYGNATPATPGQNNYFPQQAPAISQQQIPQYQQQQQPGSNSNANAGAADHAYSPAGQLPGPPTQGQYSQNQPQGATPQAPPGQISGQQTGVIGSSQPQTPGTVQQSSPATSTPQHGFSPSGQQPQQWMPAAAAPHEHAPQAPQSPSSFHPTSQSQQYNAAPPVPVHPNQQQQQSHPHQSPQQQQTHPHQSPQQQQQQQQWTPMPPASPMVQQEQGVLPGGSPLPQPSEMHKPTSPSAPFQEQQPLSTTPQPPTHPPTPISQNMPSSPPPTEFLAELPADLGTLSAVEDARPGQASPTQSQATPYQPYRPASGQSTSSGPGYTIPRRAVSTSSLPLADPWRFADPITELPTREFYIIADLVFDGIDRKFEPQNTGLLEASKVLESWKAQQLPEEAAQLFAHDAYSAFSKIWSLEGVPHLMVPIQPSLMPTWNFQQPIHSQELKIQEESALATVSYPTYMPALNRAGWYKYFFLNLLHQPEELDKMLSAFCADTYKPGILNQPDVQKRDKNESAGLVSRATAISTGAVSRVCQEVVKHMQGTSTLPQDASQASGARHGGPGGEGQSNDGGLTEADVALKMHSLQIQQQFNNMMNHTMNQGGINFSSGAGNAYKPNYGSFV